MPGSPFLYSQGINAPEGMQQAHPTAGAGIPTAPTHTSFIIWLAIIGVVIPVIILGSLRVGGFQFVFRSR